VLDLVQKAKSLWTVIGVVSIVRESDMADMDKTQS